MTAALDAVGTLAAASDREMDACARLLGLPAGGVLSVRAREQVDEARRWYAANGRPWIGTGVARQFALGSGTVSADDTVFESAPLARRLRDGGATGLAVAAVTSGAAVEHEIERRWQSGRPDDGLFLATWASVVVERLVTDARAQLQHRLSRQRLHVLPPERPGCNGWDLQDLPRLFRLVIAHRNGHVPCLAAGGHRSGSDELRLTSAGALWPARSMVVAFGVTPAQPVHALEPGCDSCDHVTCALRRAGERTA